eukprot:6471616-Amphidinium_carterae.1
MLSHALQVGEYAVLAFGSLVPRVLLPLGANQPHAATFGWEQERSASGPVRPFCQAMLIISDGCASAAIGMTVPMTVPCTLPVFVDGILCNTQAIQQGQSLAVGACSLGAAAVAFTCGQTRLTKLAVSASACSAVSSSSSPPQAQKLEAGTDEKECLRQTAAELWPEES